jgi:hypothetical protein
LTRASATWASRANAAPLCGWLERALDPDGVPRRLAIADWAECLARLAEARCIDPPAWPDAADARIEGLLRAVLRFARPDGSAVFDSTPSSTARGDLLRYWADGLSDPALSTVVNDWFPPTPKPRRLRSAPPLPADSRPDRVLAMLRADWTRHGDFLAVDQRAGDASCHVELCGQGQTWLGPAWASGAGSEPVSAARPTLWMTGPYADLAEWTFRTAAGKVVRTALLLRGRQLALLAEQVEGRAPGAGLRIAVAPGVATSAIPESRALMLSSSRGRLARVLPLGLPSLPYATERGSFAAEGDELLLRQHSEGRRRWLPLLVSWRPERDRRPTRWRVVTVTERSRICPPDVAFAARVAWGQSESLVIYRSLGRPAPRAFLGHQVRARFLVGLFTKEGNVEPIVTVEE